MTGSVFHVLPVARYWTAMRTPPVAGFVREWQFAALELLPPPTPCELVEVFDQRVVQFLVGQGRHDLFRPVPLEGVIANAVGGRDCHWISSPKASLARLRHVVRVLRSPNNHVELILLSPI